MKSVLKFVLLVSLVFTACKEEKKVEQTQRNKEESYKSFGDKIVADKAFSSVKMLATYQNLKEGDTIDVKFASTIKEVCSKKGCWMKLSLNDEEQTMVRFKDYGFFMPLDSQGKEVIISGKAFVKETSVKELQHYAEDAGKSKEEIAKIVAPKKEFAFTANGVLLK